MTVGARRCPHRVCPELPLELRPPVPAELGRLASPLDCRPQEPHHEGEDERGDDEERNHRLALSRECLIDAPYPAGLKWER